MWYAAYGIVQHQAFPVRKTGRLSLPRMAKRGKDPENETEGRAGKVKRKKKKEKKNRRRKGGKKKVWKQRWDVSVLSRTPDLPSDLGD